MNTFERVVRDEGYQKAKSDLLQSLRRNLSGLTAMRPSDAGRKEPYEKAVKEVGALRGRDLFYKMLGSGAGNGPFIELGDGSVKYDLITGIGVNFFGHGNLELFESSFDSLWCDVMQGNLSPGPEYHGLLQDLVTAAGPKSRIKHAWLTTCGATANETALKIIRQKKAPATRIFAFKDCFAGRTTALQEITDNPAYRQGQPVYGEVCYLPVDDSAAAIALMKEEVVRYPGRYAALEFELIQGEGGFRHLKPEFLIPIIKEAKTLGLAIWDDEIQTFGRTGETFAFQRFGLDEYVDVVTVGKLLQTAAVLYTDEYNAKPGLVSGTFAGASSSLSAARWVMQELRTKHSGERGRVRELERLTVAEFEALKKSEVGKHLVDYTVIGGMVAFKAFRGTLDDTKKLLFDLFDRGAVAFYCGHGPYRVRMLPPFGIITDAQWKEVFTILRESMATTAKELKL